MKICFSASGENEKSMLNARFGRCPYFLVFDTDSKQWQTVNNRAAAEFRGAGVSAAQKVADLGCQIIVTGNMGPNAFNVMNTSDIKIYSGDLEKSIVDNLAMFEDNKLQELLSPQGMGMNRGGQNK